MIKPTIGRVMWYWPDEEDRDEQPLCALVVRVHDDNMVNLAVFNADGSSGGALRVPIAQDGSPHRVGHSPYCEWMPYQKGQAAKSEALETAAAARQAGPSSY